jgi:hypothetical protein
MLFLAEVYYILDLHKWIIQRQNYSALLRQWVINEPSSST